MNRWEGLPERLESYGAIRPYKADVARDRGSLSVSPHASTLPRTWNLPDSLDAALAGCDSAQRHLNRHGLRDGRHIVRGTHRRGHRSPCSVPIDIRQDQGDHVVEVGSFGDPAGIFSGSTFNNMHQGTKFLKREQEYSTTVSFLSQLAIRTSF
jgi:hypothetical protein